MVSLDPFLKMELIKVSGEQARFEEDVLIVEHQIKLFINGEFFKSLFATPQHLKELCVGHLLDCGKINSINDIASMELSKDLTIAYIEISASNNKTEIQQQQESLIVKIPTIYKIMKEHIEPSELFAQTGGVHSVGIYEQGEPVVVMQDVARHNAVDKAIGFCLLSGISLEDKILAVSGRFSYDMLSKAMKAGITMVLSKSAPSSLSVEQGEKAGITLVGFIRGERMNVYTHPERIDLGDEAFKEIVKKNE